MTKDEALVLERLRRWLGGAPTEAPTPKWTGRPVSRTPQPEIAYAIRWLEEIRDWPPDARRDVAAAVQAVVTAPDFAPTSTRRYTVDGLEGSHSGASLIALAQTLAEWDAGTG